MPVFVVTWAIFIDIRRLERTRKTLSPISSSLVVRGVCGETFTANPSLVGDSAGFWRIWNHNNGLRCDVIQPMVTSKMEGTEV